MKVLVPPEFRPYTTRAGFDSRCHGCRRTIAAGDLILFRPARWLSVDGTREQHRPTVRWHYVCGVRDAERWRVRHEWIGAA